MERHAALSNAKEGQGNVMRGERHCGATSRPFAVLRHGVVAMEQSSYAPIGNGDGWRCSVRAGRTISVYGGALQRLGKAALCLV